MNSKLLKAISKAAVWHDTQYRKFNKQPYIVHPLDVLDKLNETIKYWDLEIPNKILLDMQIAACLHDVIEDCGVTCEQIAGEFGKGAADIVVGLTDTSKASGKNRKERKVMDFNRMNSQPFEVQLVKYCDIKSNIKDVVTEDPSFAKTLLSEKLVYVDCLTQIPDYLVHVLKSEIEEKLEILNSEESANV